MTRLDASPLREARAGVPYSALYDARLAFWALLASLPDAVEVEGHPSCWAPLIHYLGHEDITPGARWFDVDRVDWRSFYIQSEDRRLALEVTCATRPELVHALYLVDTAWPCPCRSHAIRPGPFVITTLSGFQAPELWRYHHHLAAFVPRSRKAVLVSCSADKPYPAPLHRAVLDRLPLGWDLYVVSGALGLAPQPLWSLAPHYDAGLPNFQRVEDTCRWFFSKHAHDRIVVYSDFYGSTIARALPSIPEADFIFGRSWRDTYENALLPAHLARLSEALAR